VKAPSCSGLPADWKAFAGVRQEVDYGYLNPEHKFVFGTIELDVNQHFNESLYPDTVQDVLEVLGALAKKNLKIKDIWPPLPVMPTFRAWINIKPTFRIDPAAFRGLSLLESFVRPLHRDWFRHGREGGLNSQPAKNQSPTIPVDEAKDSSLIIYCVLMDLKDGLAVPQEKRRLSPLFGQLMVNEVCANNGCHYTCPSRGRRQPRLHAAIVARAERPTILVGDEYDQCDGTDQCEECENRNVKSCVVSHGRPPFYGDHGLMRPLRKGERIE